MVTPNSVRLALILTNKNGFPEVKKLIEEGTQISVLENQIGSENVYLLMIKLITDLGNYFNVYNPLKDSQVEMLASELMLEYWYYTIEDFVCFFHLLRRGFLETNFDKINNHIDPKTIYHFLNKYDALRTEKIIEMRSQEREIEAPKFSEKAVDLPSGSLLEVTMNIIKAIKARDEGADPVEIKQMSKEETEKLFGKPISDEVWQKEQERNNPKKEPDVE